MQVPVKAKRTSSYTVAPYIIDRWSPRALSGASISDQELMTLFEAARWAPSSYNNQPWHFIYAKRGTESWQRLFNLMVGFNQSWAQRAAVLIVLISSNTFENGKPSRTHSFDSGAAWENLALQAAYMGLIAHGMEGFDYARAKKELSIPDGYTVEAMIAVGKPGEIEDLPKEVQEREKPSDRKPLTASISEGVFKK